MGLVPHAAPSPAAAVAKTYDKETKINACDPSCNLMRMMSIDEHQQTSLRLKDNNNGNHKTTTKTYHINGNL